MKSCKTDSIVFILSILCFERNTMRLYRILKSHHKIFVIYNRVCLLAMMAKIIETQLWSTRPPPLAVEMFRLNMSLKTSLCRSLIITLITRIVDV